MSLLGIFLILMLWLIPGIFTFAGGISWWLKNFKKLGLDKADIIATFSLASLGIVGFGLGLLLTERFKYGFRPGFNWMLSPLNRDKKTKSPSLTKCPHCREKIPENLTICPECYKYLIVVDPQTGDLERIDSIAKCSVENWVRIKSRRLLDPDDLDF